MAADVTITPPTVVVVDPTVVRMAPVFPVSIVSLSKAPVEGVVPRPESGMIYPRR